MAGLYNGAEELAFTPVAGGFVFQTNNPWLFGPRRRYFVNEAQKAIIAARIRETLRRIIPVVIVAAIVIPLALVGGTLWLAFQGASLGVTVTSATGKTTSYIQGFDPGRQHRHSGRTGGRKGRLSRERFPRERRHDHHDLVRCERQSRRALLQSLRPRRDESRHRRRQSPHDQHGRPRRPPRRDAQCNPALRDAVGLCDVRAVFRTDAPLQYEAAAAAAHQSAAIPTSASRCATNRGASPAKSLSSCWW